MDWSAGLIRWGLACLSFHFTGDREGIRSCPHVRVIFADLHLNEGSAGTEDAQHFSLIGGLIQDTIKPSGPYVLILWTKYSDKADNLRRFLDERLETTPGPLAVKAIDKMLHLEPNGNIQSTEKLVAEITSLLDKEPQVAALLNWEERVLDATANTVSSIFDLAEETQPGGCSRQAACPSGCRSGWQESCRTGPFPRRERGLVAHPD